MPELTTPKKCSLNSIQKKTVKLNCRQIIMRPLLFRPIEIAMVPVPTGRFTLSCSELHFAPYMKFPLPQQKSLAASLIRDVVMHFMQQCGGKMSAY